MSLRVETLEKAVCPDAQLHKPWRDGRFALERMGHATQIYGESQWCQRVRFHCMKETSLENVSKAMDFNTDAQDGWEVVEKLENLSFSYSVGDGRINNIFATRKDDLPDCEILWIQLKLIVAWSLQEGDEAVLYDDGEDEYDPNLAAWRKQARGFLGAAIDLRRFRKSLRRI